MLRAFAALLGLLGVLVSAPGADAIRIRAESDVVFGSDVLLVGDTVTVSLYLDMQGQLELQILDVGLLFDGAAYSFDEPASSMTSYLLYSPTVGKSIPYRWLQPLPNHINGGSLDFHGGLDATPKLYTGPIPNLITTGYQTPDFGGTQVAADDLLLATVVFHVIGHLEDRSLSPTGFELAITPANLVAWTDRGGCLASGCVELVQIPYVPEPGTGVLLAVGIALLSRSRRAAR